MRGGNTFSEPGNEGPVAEPAHWSLCRSSDAVDAEDVGALAVPLPAFTETTDCLLTLLAPAQVSWGMAVGRAISGHTKLAIECSLVLAGVARQRPDPVTDLHGAACARSSFSGRASVDIWDTIDPVATYDFDPNVCRIRWQAYDYQVDGSIMEHQRHGTPHHMVVPLLLVT